MHAGIVSRLPATGCVHYAPPVRAGISRKHQPGGPAIHPYQIMMILNPDADQEAQAEITSRVRTLVEEAGGTVNDVAEWGRRPIAYPVRKHADGVYVIVTCEASSAAIDEVTRVLGISKEEMYAPVEDFAPKLGEHCDLHDESVPVVHFLRNM